MESAVTVLPEPDSPTSATVSALPIPHLRARGFLTDVETEAGVVALPNSPMRYEGSALMPLVAPPALGEHTDSVLAQLCDLDAAAIATLRSEGVI